MEVNGDQQLYCTHIFQNIILTEFLFWWAITFEERVLWPYWHINIKSKAFFPISVALMHYNSLMQKIIHAANFF